MPLSFLINGNKCLSEEYVHNDNSVQSSKYAVYMVFWKSSCTHTVSELLPVPIPFVVKLYFIAQTYLHCLGCQEKNECSCSYFMSQMVLIHQCVPGTAERKSLPYLVICSSTVSWLVRALLLGVGEESVPFLAGPELIL